MNQSTDAQRASNPLLEAWESNFGLPPFDQVLPSHFTSAFALALPEHLAEIEAIANCCEAPSFDNTLAEFDRSGRLLERITLLFHNLTSSETSDALRAVQLEMAPRLAAHENAIFMHAGLFARVDALYQQRTSLELDADQLRLLERVHLDFVRAGALLRDQDRVRYGEIMGSLASLCTQFSQNILSEEAAYVLPLTSEADLAGLPDPLHINAAWARMPLSSPCLPRWQSRF